jgi:hypothetical protein
MTGEGLRTHRAALVLQPSDAVEAIGWRLAKPGNENGTQHLCAPDALIARSN